MAASDVTQRVTDYRFTIPQMLWFGAGCVAVTLLIGFAAAGWVTGGAAKQQADMAAAAARTELGVAVCVEDFMQASDAGKRLASLKDTEWYLREKLVSDAGFATLPGSDAADGAVAAQCAMQLSELNPKKSLASTVR
jgi:hypothetical protein